jgi:hypothetical protein
VNVGALIVGTLFVEEYNKEPWASPIQQKALEVKTVGGNLISARTTDLQGCYEFISIKWP